MDCMTGSFSQYLIVGMRSDVLGNSISDPVVRLHRDYCMRLTYKPIPIVISFRLLQRAARNTESSLIYVSRKTLPGNSW